MAEAICPLCGSTRKLARRLYEREVCKRCWAGFINRRQLAWILDLFPLGLAAFLVADLVLRLPEPPAGFVPRAADWPYYVVVAALLAVKDGFGGHSLGKAICGLQVVDSESGEPAGLLPCALRNWFLAVPYMPLYVALTMNRGPRLGDGIAKTRVIWKRHRNSPVFSGVTGVAKVFE